jgi:hypothetical protein
MPIDNIRDSDVFLVSYPRSGNTWVRAIISEILYGTSGDSLNELGRFVPDIHAACIDTLQLSHPRVIKSHFNYTRRYKRVLYIVRDPRDVCLSHYKYLKQRRYPSMTLEGYVDDACSGKLFPGTWCEHVKSWLLENEAYLSADNLNFLLLKFEEILHQPEIHIRKIADFLGKDVRFPKAKEIKRKTSIQAMKQKERNGSFEWLPKDLEFINNGATGSWIDKMPEKLNKKIVSVNETEMKALEYL